MDDNTPRSGEVASPNKSGTSDNQQPGNKPEPSQRPDNPSTPGKEQASPDKAGQHGDKPSPDNASPPDNKSPQTS